MKKLLMLLVFSASFFASAQTITLVELTSTSGRGTFGPNAIHAIQGDDISPYVYEGYTTNVVSYTIRDGVFTAPDEVYSLVGSYGYEARDFIYTLGLTGKFYNSTSREELQGVRLSSYHREPLFVNLEADEEWNIDPLAPSYFERRDCGFVFQVAEIGPSHGYPQFRLSRNTLAGDSYELLIARNFFDYPGTYFRSDADVIEAVNRVLIDSRCLTAPTCTLDTRSSVLDKYPALNEGRAFGSYVAGTTDWNPQETENTVWTYSIPREEQASGRGGFYYQISEIDSENVFRLYRGFENGGIAGDSGSLGSYEEFECLEDLIAVLQ